MSTTKSTGTKKAGAAKKGGLSVIEGGAVPLLSDGKTPANVDAMTLLSDGKTPANVDAMTRALEAYGVAMKPNASPEEKLKAVRKYLTAKLKTVEEKDQMVCSNVCGEVATEETDCCPYCGDAGADEGSVAAAQTAAPAVAEKPAKGSKPVVAMTEGLAQANASLALHIEKINSLRGNIAVNSHQLGVEIRAIHEAELWKASGHASFKEFVEKELEMSRAMAYKLMDVVKQFDEPTFAKVGATKLWLVAGIEDEEAREAALAAAKAGATTKDVQRAANESKGKPSAPPKEKPSSAAPPKKSGGEITLLAKVGTKPQLCGWRSATSGRPIQHHKDDAYVEVQIAEGLVQRLALKVDKDGNILGITVAFVRAQ